VGTGGGERRSTSEQTCGVSVGAPPTDQIPNAINIEVQGERMLLGKPLRQGGLAASRRPVQHDQPRHSTRVYENTRIARQHLRRFHPNRDAPTRDKTSRWADVGRYATPFGVHRECRKRCSSNKEDIVVSAVTTEKSRTAGAVVEKSAVPAQAGPADEQVATAEAIAEALGPALVLRLAAQVRTQGLQLLGCGGALQQMTRRFLEAALEEHLGYDRHDPADREGVQ
jgi:hypothetical protein